MVIIATAIPGCGRNDDNSLATTKRRPFLNAYHLCWQRSARPEGACRALLS